MIQNIFIRWLAQQISFKKKNNKSPDTYEEFPSDIGGIVTGKELLDRLMQNSDDFEKGKIEIMNIKDETIKLQEKIKDYFGKNKIEYKKLKEEAQKHREDIKKFTLKIGSSFINISEEVSSKLNELRNAYDETGAPKSKYEFIDTAEKILNETKNEANLKIDD